MTALPVSDRLKKDDHGSPTLRRVKARYDALPNNRPVVSVGLPSPVADAAPGMLSLQVVECVAAAPMSSNDVAAMERPRVHLAAAGRPNQPVRLVVGDRSAASGTRSALRLDDGTVLHVERISVPTVPVRRRGEDTWKSRRSPIARLCTRFLVPQSGVAASRLFLRPGGVYGCAK